VLLSWRRTLTSHMAGDALARVSEPPSNETNSRHLCALYWLNGKAIVQYSINEMPTISDQEHECRHKIIRIDWLASFPHSHRERFRWRRNLT
jgi:hypothetical protein